MRHDFLQQEIVKACVLMKLHVHYCGMRHSQPGWPDLVIVGTRGVLFRELKVPPDQLNSAQRALGYNLLASGMNWAVWTPDDLASCKIIGEIKDIR